MLCSYIKDKLYENVDKVQEMLVVYYTIDKLKKEVSERFEQQRNL